MFVKLSREGTQSQFDIDGFLKSCPLNAHFRVIYISLYLIYKNIGTHFFFTISLRSVKLKAYIATSIRYLA